MNESAAKIISLYERHAEAFAKLRSTELFEQTWLDRFLSQIADSGHILDIGCGNGTPIAAYLIERGYSVTGIDAAPAMIARCRSKFPAQRWQVADMRQLALQEKFDGLLAWDSFFHLTQQDQRRMFGIFKQHAGERAALMFTSGPQAGEAIGEFEGEPLFHASLAPETYRELLQENGFTVVQMIAQDPQCQGHTVWLARYSTES